MINLLDKLFELRFKNNNAFNELSKENQETVRLIYQIFRSNIPLAIKLSLNINDTFINNLINLIKGNSGHFIGKLYVSFMENIIIKMDYYEVKYRKSSYDDALSFKSERDFYRMFNLFLNYLDKIIFDDNNKYKLLLDNLTFNDKQILSMYEIFCTFRDKMNEIPMFHQITYLNIIKNLFAIHIYNNDLLYDVEHYRKMCNYIIDNKKDIFDHYYLQYQDDYSLIIKEIFLKMNNKKEKKIIR